MVRASDMIDLSTFCAVAEAQSFTDAATKLGVSQTLVSKRIKKLELRLGAQLINRSSRGFSLTEVGRGLYERFAAISDEIREAELSAQRLAGSAEGVARLAAPLVCAYIGVPNNQTMLETFPDLSVEMTIVDGDIDLINGGYDAAIHIGEVRESNLVVRKLTNARFCVVATPGYVSEHGAPRYLEDLAHFECLSGSENGRREWVFQSKCDKEPFRWEVHGRYSANSELVLHRACLLGMGYAQLAMPLIYEDLKAGRLVRVLEDFSYRTHPINVIYPSHNITDRTRSLVELVIEYLKSQLPEVGPQEEIQSGEWY